MSELPMLPRSPVCPAALAIAGASGGQQGVVCREMQQDQEADPGLGMSAGQLERAREGEGGVYLNLKADPSSVTMFCHGDAVPVVTDEDGQGRASYTYCPTWQTARKRALAGEHGLTDAVVADAVSMGLEDEDDGSWQTAQRRLDELAPPPDREAIAPAEVADTLRGFDHRARGSVWR